MTRPLLTAILALSLGAALFRAEAITLTLDQPAQSGGPPGAVVGWSFALFNDSGYNLSVTSVYADDTLYGTDGHSALGQFIDAVALWAQLLGGLTVADTETFTGTFPDQALALFAIDTDAPVGAPPVIGHIFLTYGLDDPSGTVGLLTARYQGQDALASVTVTAAATPAPGTAALLLAGLAGAVRRRAVRQKGQTPAPTAIARPVRPPQARTTWMRRPAGLLTSRLSVRSASGG